MHTYKVSINIDNHSFLFVYDIKKVLKKNILDDLNSKIYVNPDYIWYKIYKSYGNNYCSIINKDYIELSILETTIIDILEPCHGCLYELDFQHNHPCIF